MGWDIPNTQALGRNKWTKIRLVQGIFIICFTFIERCDTVFGCVSKITGIMWNLRDLNLFYMLRIYFLLFVFEISLVQWRRHAEHQLSKSNTPNAYYIHVACRVDSIWNQVRDYIHFKTIKPMQRSCNLRINNLKWIKRTVLLGLGVERLHILIF